MVAAKWSRVNVLTRYLQSKYLLKKLCMKLPKFLNRQFSVLVWSEEVLNKSIPHRPGNVTSGAAVSMAMTNRRRVQHNISDLFKLIHINFSITIKVKHLESYLKMVTGG